MIDVVVAVAIGVPGAVLGGLAAVLILLDSGLPCSIRRCGRGAADGSSV